MHDHLLLQSIASSSPSLITTPVVSPQLTSRFTLLTADVGHPALAAANVHPVSAEAYATFCLQASAVDDVAAAQMASGERFHCVPGLSFPSETALQLAPYVDLRRRTDEMRTVLAFECAQSAELQRRHDDALELHLTTKDHADGDSISHHRAHTATRGVLASHDGTCCPLCPSLCSAREALRAAEATAPGSRGQGRVSRSHPTPLTGGHTGLRSDIPPPSSAWPWVCNDSAREEDHQRMQLDCGLMRTRLTAFEKERQPSFRPARCPLSSASVSHLPVAPLSVCSVEHSGDAGGGQEGGARLLRSVGNTDRFGGSALLDHQLDSQL